MVLNVSRMFAQDCHHQLKESNICSCRTASFASACCYWFPWKWEDHSCQEAPWLFICHQFGWIFRMLFFFVSRFVSAFQEQHTAYHNLSFFRLMQRRGNLRVAAVAHDLAATINVDAAFLASMDEVQRG